VLIFEGGESHEVFLVLRGEAEVSRSSQPVAVLREGAFFGEVGVLASHCRDAQVRATTRMLVLVLGRREFIGLLAAIPPLNRSLLGGMASRLHESDLARGAR
jgi:CRP-like cAMP-binding protein